MQFIHAPQWGLRPAAVTAVPTGVGTPRESSTVAAEDVYELANVVAEMVAQLILERGPARMPEARAQARH